MAICSLGAAFAVLPKNAKNLFKNCVKVKNISLLRLNISQKSKIILSKGYANALPVVVLDAVTSDAVYVDRAMLTLY